MAERHFPSVFVSHGAPTMAFGVSAGRAFLGGLGESLGRPRAVVCVSAHWETETPAVTGSAEPETIHDFFGFPDPLYQARYPAPGAPDLAARVAGLLDAMGYECETAPDRGLDHGAWIPLMLMYPGADIPVIQLSIQTDLGPGYHLHLGRALAPLRGDGVLVLGSGGAVHNLQHFQAGSTEVPGWAREFDDWLADAVIRGDEAALVDYRSPAGAMAHPTDEHYLPLLTALGAGGDGVNGRVLHRGFMDGALSMAAFAFG